MPTTIRPVEDEDADAIVAGGHLRERADADEILETADPVSHATPSWAATRARPPAFIQASMALA